MNALIDKAVSSFILIKTDVQAFIRCYSISFGTVLIKITYWDLDKK